MEKAFALKGSHFPVNNVARYLTLDSEVELIFFLKKTEWPNRAKEEIFRCALFRCYIRPKEPKIQKDGLYYHKITCNQKGGPRPTLEVEGKRPGEGKEVSLGDSLDRSITPE